MRDEREGVHRTRSSGLYCALAGGQDRAVVALCPLAPAPHVQEKRLFPSWLCGAGSPVTTSAPRLTSAWIMSV